MADLEDAFGEALKRPAVADPAPDLEIDFDDDGSPWHTLCEIRGADRHGLLHMITVGFAAAGVTVHAARIETTAGVAIDRFEVTDTDGRKLDDARAARGAPDDLVGYHSHVDVRRPLPVPAARRTLSAQARRPEPSSTTVLSGCRRGARGGAPLAPS